MYQQDQYKYTSSKAARKTLVKLRPVAISLMFYVRVFHMKVFSAAFLGLESGLEQTFIQKMRT